MTVEQEYPTASLRRRLAAQTYDFFLLFALWAVTGSILLMVFGDSAPEDRRLPEQAPLSTIWVQLICYVEIFLFYFYFWLVKGQSLGMQVWKIRAVNNAGEIMGAKDAAKRFLCATISMMPLGIGMFWALINKQHLALHDVWSGTKVVYLGQKPYPSEKLDRRDEVLPE
ncbi:RDD family protein [Pseudomonadales bacterium]|jgi:uncharacterized RDD family membrane protein YckC|nr:RDD family protein [Pseudomonadales bacterium]MDC1018789.1 RDD family protein [Pseudomonadales bacterium]|tara:strand:- start:1710 stop:2216 length:507 start_codon:yes stop_codon:yes gene_type:complete